LTQCFLEAISLPFVSLHKITQEAAGWEAIAIRSFISIQIIFSTASGMIVTWSLLELKFILLHCKASKQPINKERLNAFFKEKIIQAWRYWLSCLVAGFFLVFVRSMCLEWVVENIFWFFKNNSLENSFIWNSEYSKTSLYLV